MKASDINPGFWNCCIARPAKAVKFIREETNEVVWYAACNSCASSVSADRIAELPKMNAREVRQDIVNRLAKAYDANLIDTMKELARAATFYGKRKDWALKSREVTSAIQEVEVDGAPMTRVLQAIINLNLYVSK